MKIVNIYNGFLSENFQGGGVRYIKNLIAQQKKLGFEVEVICCGSTKIKTKTINGCKYNFVSNSLTWPLFLLRLLVFMIVNRKNYKDQMFHIHRSYFAPALLFLSSPRIFLTIHTKTFHVITSKFTIIKYLLPILIKIDNFIINKLITTVSIAGHEARKNFKNYSLKNKKLVFLPPPIFLNKQKLKISLNNTILIVGRLSPVKRPQKIISLIHNAYMIDPITIKKFKFIFIGDGELKETLQKMIGTLNLSSIIKLAGNITYNNVLKYYRKCNKTILLSESEIGPYVVKESLFFGKAVFTTNVGDIKNYFTKDCGRIIPKSKPENRMKEFLDFLNTDYSSKKIQETILRQIDLENKSFTNNLIKLYAK